MATSRKHSGSAKIQTIYIDRSVDDLNHGDCSAEDGGEDVEALERLVQKDADNYKKAQQELQAMWDLFDTAEGKRQLEELQREKERSALLERQKAELRRQREEHDRLLKQQRHEAEIFKLEELKKQQKQLEIHAEIRESRVCSKSNPPPPRKHPRQYPAGEKTYDVVRGRSVSPQNSARKVKSMSEQGGKGIQEKVVTGDVDVTTESIDITMEEEDRWVHRVVVMEREEKLHSGYKEKIRKERQRVKELENQVALLSAQAEQTCPKEPVVSSQRPEDDEHSSFNRAMDTYLNAQRELFSTSLDQIKEFVADALVVAVGGNSSIEAASAAEQEEKDRTQEEAVLELRNKREAVKEAELALEKRIRQQDEAERQMEAFIERSKRQLEIEHNEALSRVARKEEEVRQLRSKLMGSSLLSELSALQMSANDKTLRLIEKERQLLQREEEVKQRESSLKVSEQQASQTQVEVVSQNQHTQERLAALETTLLSTKHQLEDEWESLASAKADFITEQATWRQEQEQILASKIQEKVEAEGKLEAEYHQSMETIRILRAELEADREAFLLEKEHLSTEFEKHQTVSRQELEGERVKVKAMHDEASKLFEEREEELRNQSIALQEEVAKVQQERAEIDLQTARLLKQEATLEQLEARLQKERALIRRERESLERDLALGADTITKSYSSSTTSSHMEAKEGQPPKAPSISSSPTSSIISSAHRPKEEDRLRKKQSLEKLQEVYKMLNSASSRGSEAAGSSVNSSTVGGLATVGAAKEVTFATRGSSLNDSAAARRVIVSPLRSPSLNKKAPAASSMITETVTEKSEAQHHHWRSVENTFTSNENSKNAESILALSEQEEKDDKELERGLAALESIFVHYRKDNGHDAEEHIDSSPRNTMALPKNIYALQREWLELHRLRRETQAELRESGEPNSLRTKYLAARDDWWSRLRVEARHYFEHIGGARLF